MFKISQKSVAPLLQFDHSQKDLRVFDLRKLSEVQPENILTSAQATENVQDSIVVIGDADIEEENA